MLSHAQPQYLTAGMLQNQKSIQQPERDRGDHEQIHRRDAVRCSRGSIRIRQQAFSALDGVPANLLRQGYDESVYDERGDQ